MTTVRELHRLTLRSRSTPKTYSPNHDGECSCGKWIMRNYAREVIRREHWEHVEKNAGTEGGSVTDWSHIPAEVIAAWPNCATPDCEYKTCTWAPSPQFCYPCNEARFGAAIMRAAWDTTHDTPWDQA